MSEEKLLAELRQTKLTDRLMESAAMISAMCAEGRCPKMSIPVRAVDEDFYITTTLNDAFEEIARLTAELARLQSEPAGEREVIQLIKERDDMHEWADKLAASIAEQCGLEIGEHSSGNNPWENALNRVSEDGE